MALRKLTAIGSVAAALALAAVPVADAQTPAADTGPAGITCYPYPALCGPDGQPFRNSPFFFPLFGISGLTGTTPPAGVTPPVNG